MKNRFQDLWRKAKNSRYRIPLLIELVAIMVLVIILATLGISGKLGAKKAEASEKKIATAEDIAKIASTPTTFADMVESKEVNICLTDYKNDPDTVVLLAAGDNLIHQTIIDSMKSGDTYDFTPLYKNVKERISAADIALVNQETPLATEIGEPEGYPTFNTPTEAGDALIDAGFDIFNIGTNHSYDQGDAGIAATIEYLNSQNIPYIGISKRDSDDDGIRIIEVKGIKIAFVGFFRSVNQTVYSSTDYNFILLDEPDRIEDQIKKARSQADLLVVHAHWGDEESEEINEEQKEMAKKMAEWGADIIIGDHPHVIQDLTVISGSEGKAVPVAYSLGNFISAMDHKNDLISGLFELIIRKDETTGKVSPVSMEFYPIVTHYGDNYADPVIIPFEDYTEELAESHGVNKKDGPLTLDYIRNDLESHINYRYIGQARSVFVWE